ncbi:MAG: hypothetical protein EBU49_15725 [Proteobacteria bacterium]|nr:hypothetical protein [Pseudomonadota bacterium]
MNGTYTTAARTMAQAVISKTDWEVVGLCIGAHYINSGKKIRQDLLTHLKNRLRVRAESQSRNENAPRDLRDTNYVVIFN